MYNLAINLYSLAAKADALFSKKVKTMLKGQQDCYEVLRSKIEPERRYIWFHAASLGEFEQGRPLMERIRQEYPSYGILLTFLSAFRQASKCEEVLGFGKPLHGIFHQV